MLNAHYLDKYWATNQINIIQSWRTCQQLPKRHTSRFGACVPSYSCIRCDTPSTTASSRSSWRSIKQIEEGPMLFRFLRVSFASSKRQITRISSTSSISVWSRRLSSPKWRMFAKSARSCSPNRKMQFLSSRRSAHISPKTQNLSLLLNTNRWTNSSSSPDSITKPIMNPSSKSQTCIWNV